MFLTEPLDDFESLSARYGGRIQIAGARGSDHLQFSVEAAPATWLRRIGLTVFFGDDLCPYVPGLAAWLRTLETELGAPRGIGAVRAFASAPGGGLEAHYDQGETFLVQLSGTKRLRVSENTTYPTLQFIPGKPPADEHYPEFTSGFPAKAPRGRTVTMKPGSVLYLPRGAWHRTEAGTESFSLSICVDTPNAIDVVLVQLKHVLRQSAAWRRPLFGAWNGRQGESARELSALLSQLGSLAPALDAELMIDHAMRSEAVLRPSTRLQRVPTTRLRVVREGSRRTVRVSTDEREARVLIDSALEPAAKWLERHRAAFTLGALQARVAPSRHLARLVSSLIQLDALKWLPYDEVRP